MSKIVVPPRGRQSCRGALWQGLVLSLLLPTSACVVAGGSDSSSVNTSSDGIPTTVDGMDPNAPGALQLSGCFQADYSAVGTVGPTTNLNLLVDSGSMSLAVASSLCNSCQGLFPLYEPSGPDTADQHATVQQLYGDADASTQTGWVGEVFADKVSLGTLASTKMRLAAITDQSTDSAGNPTMFVDSTCSGRLQHDPQQGIIGLAPSNLGPNKVDSFLNKWAAATASPNYFAVQLCDVGGRLWLGKSYDANFTTAPPDYTPMAFSKMPNAGFYLVTISSMAVGNATLPVDANNFTSVLADTGTSVMTVTYDVLVALAQILESNSAFVDTFGVGFIGTGNCAVVPNLSRAQLDAQLPKMTLTLPGVGGGSPIKVALPATSSYLIPALTRDGGTQYCAAIQAGTLPGAGQINAILGNSMMHRHVMIFDLDQQRLGFAPMQKCTQTLQ